jgi:hypothetical protein
LTSENECDNGPELGTIPVVPSSVAVFGSISIASPAVTTSSICGVDMRAVLLMKGLERPRMFLMNAFLREERMDSDSSLSSSSESSLSEGESVRVTLLESDVGGSVASSGEE